MTKASPGAKGVLNAAYQGMSPLDNSLSEAPA
jgi:hypothetical protein